MNASGRKGKTHIDSKASLAQLPTIDEVLRQTIQQVLAKLQTSESGLTSGKAAEFLSKYGYNDIILKKKRAAITEFFLHFKNPLVMILLIAGFIAGYFGELLDTAIIVVIVLISVVLDFFQEYRAGQAAEELKDRVATTATVLRDGTKQEVKLSEIVPGDVIALSAGDIVPADARLITAKDVHMDQSALTGESFPVEKFAGPIKTKNIGAITEWDNYLFTGTSLLSGFATAVAVRTGVLTQYGGIVRKLAERRPETEFERGLRRFGYLIMQVTLSLVIFVFFINALYLRGILDSLLFAVALAVGLTPELLPMILSINLSKGAISMSRKGVVVKRLGSIQNFGSMDILCTDKTGTITENKITLRQHLDLEGRDSDKVLLYSFLNSQYQTGIKSAIDDAILEHRSIDLQGYQKVDDVPFDFTRKRVSVVVERNGERTIITKGAPDEIIKICTHFELNGKISELPFYMRKRIEDRFHDLSSKGLRVIAVSFKKTEAKPSYRVQDEDEMVFLGMDTFIDPPKKTAKKSLLHLRQAAVDLKILTGDNELVTSNVCEQIGFEIKGILLGDEINRMTDEALARVAEDTNIFARLTPAQKDRIINVLRRAGHVVGFLGDGINDSPSMRVSDVSISVSNAVDIAKETADIILIHKDLSVLADGVLEGRKTFGNTMKYIQMGVSSNFGNMFSVAGASLFLPFLPMLPIQILLNNLLYDMSELALPSDNVDKEYVATPKRMDISFVRNYMIYFGPISSVFDFLTFFIMLYVFSATEPLFQTAWFLESLLTQTLVVYLIRTRKVFFRSRPSGLLILSGLSVVVFALILPFTLLGSLFTFVTPPNTFYLALAAIVVTYLALVEVLKRKFYKRYAHRIEQVSPQKAWTG